MREGKFKIVLDCPLCKEHELQVQDTGEDNTIKQCLACGYSTGQHLIGTKKENEDFKKMDSTLRNWAVESDGQIWIPVILNTQMGIVYPIEQDDKMKWAYAPTVPIPKEEQKDFPVPNQPGKYYSSKYDIDNEAYFDSFKAVLQAMEVLSQKQKERQEEFQKAVEEEKANLAEDTKVIDYDTTINDEYNRKYESQFGDMWEHFPTLKKYASECDHVLELGFRWLNSTWAFLSAQVDNKKPKKFVTCDIEYHPNIKVAEKLAKDEGIDFEYIIGDDLKVELPETDLMFIDTQHTYTQLKKELFHLHHLSRKYIIMHDTVSFERHGLANSGCEFHETKGLKDAIELFLESHGDEWEIHEHHTYCNGLTIMKRK